MTYDENVTLSAPEAKAVARDTEKAFVEAERAADAAPPPPLEPPSEPEQPKAPSLEDPELTPEDVKDLLEMSEDLFPTKAESPIWYAPTEREREKLGKPLARVANKWLPWLQTRWKEEFGLAIVLVVIYGTRRKAHLAELRAAKAERVERHEAERLERTR